MPLNGNSSPFSFNGEQYPYLFKQTDSWIHSLSPKQTHSSRQTQEILDACLRHSTPKWCSKKSNQLLKQRQRLLRALNCTGSRLRYEAISQVVMILQSISHVVMSHRKLFHRWLWYTESYSTGDYDTPKATPQVLMIPRKLFHRWLCSTEISKSALESNDTTLVILLVLHSGQCQQAVWERSDQLYDGQHRTGQGLQVTNVQHCHFRWPMPANLPFATRTVTQSYINGGLQKKKQKNTLSLPVAYTC